MEQSVSRADLLYSESTPSPEPDQEVIERLKQLADFEFIEHGAAPKDSEKFFAGGEEEEQLDFQLFATSEPTAAAITKIRLRSPTPTSAQAGFIKPDRDRKYYFAEPLSDAEKQRLATVAVTGRDILNRSHEPEPGNAYPWKVLLLPLSSLTGGARRQAASLLPKLVEENSTPKKRTRPGKKYRLRVRTKLAANRAKQEMKHAKAEAKEAAERDKKAKRNRDKKIKRRARERAKKAVAPDALKEGLDMADGISDETH